MFSQDRHQLRQMFFSAWQKYCKKEPLEPLEQMVAAIVAQHSEYHALLEDEAGNLDKDYPADAGETNPFLHMALHVAVQEQLGSQQPEGIVELFQVLANKLQDPHEVEHRIMNCLVEMMWQAQHDERPPDEQHYLECIRKQI